MANLAAVLPSPKSPLKVEQVGTYLPGPNEILVKNEIIAFSPFEYRLAKLAVRPLPYPTILSASFGGTVTAVGSNITKFKVGDKIAAASTFATPFSNTEAGDLDRKYGSFQRFVIAREDTCSRIEDSMNLQNAASLVGNLCTIVGLFTASAGLERPSLENDQVKKKGKVLIYGGSSSVGSFSVQYVSQAGYEVVTTSSLNHMDFVKRLGGSKVVDHRQAQSALVKELVEQGPYDLVVDCISFPITTSIASKVLTSQGGGKLYSLLPAFGQDKLPEGIVREYKSWPAVLGEEKYAELLRWAFEIYFPEAVKNKGFLGLSTEEVRGGLEAAEEALERLRVGVSGVKLIADPWG